MNIRIVMLLTLLIMASIPTMPAAAFTMTPRNSFSQSLAEELKAFRRVVQLNKNRAPGHAGQGMVYMDLPNRNGTRPGWPSGTSGT